MAGGLTKGKSHAKGGIKMKVKSTGQNIEVEGGEGIINKHVMSSREKYDYEGKEMTACEIASDLNQKTGNGVKFDCEETKNTDMTPTNASTGFSQGGKVKIPKLPTKKEVDELFSDETQWQRDEKGNESVRTQVLNDIEENRRNFGSYSSGRRIIKKFVKGEFTILYINEDGEEELWSRGATFGAKENKWSELKNKFKKLYEQGLEVISVDQIVYVYISDDFETLWDTDNREEYSIRLWDNPKFIEEPIVEEKVTPNPYSELASLEQIYYVEVIKDKEKYRAGESDVELIEDKLTYSEAEELKEKINKENPNWVVFIDTKENFAKGGDVISEKIKILREEGYPPKQATAIAYSMQEQGKLAKGGRLEYIDFEDGVYYQYPRKRAMNILNRPLSDNELDELRYANSLIKYANDLTYYINNDNRYDLIAERDMQLQQANAMIEKLLDAEYQFSKGGKTKSNMIKYKRKYRSGSNEITQGSFNVGGDDFSIYILKQDNNTTRDLRIVRDKDGTEVVNAIMFKTLKEAKAAAKDYYDKINKKFESDVDKGERPPLSLEEMTGIAFEAVELTRKKLKVIFPDDKDYPEYSAENLKLNMQLSGAELYQTQDDMIQLLQRFETKERIGYNIRDNRPLMVKMLVSALIGYQHGFDFIKNGVGGEMISNIDGYLTPFYSGSYKSEGELARKLQAHRARWKEVTFKALFDDFYTLSLKYPSLSWDYIFKAFKINPEPYTKIYKAQYKNLRNELETYYQVTNYWVGEHIVIEKKASSFKEDEFQKGIFFKNVKNKSGVTESSTIVDLDLVLKESPLQGGYVDIHCMRLPLYNMFIESILMMGAGKKHQTGKYGAYIKDAGYYITGNYFDPNEIESDKRWYMQEVGALTSFPKLLKYREINIPKVSKPIKLLNAQSITTDLDSLEDDIIKSYDKLVYSGKLSGEIEKQKSKIITSALSIAEKYL